MQEKLDEIQRDLDEMQRHLDAMTGLVKSAYATRSFPIMRTTYELLREESREMNRAANEVNRKFEDLQEKNRMKRLSLLVLSLVLLFFVSSFVVAQDSPLATNTLQIVEGTATVVSSEPLPSAQPPVGTVAPATVATDIIAATDEAPVVIITTKPIIDNNPPPVDNGVNNYYVIGFVIFVLASVGRDYLKHRETASLVNGVNSLAQNQQTMTLAQQQYNMASVGTQQVVEMFRAFVGVIAAANIPGIDPLADAGKAALDKIVGAPTVTTQPAPGQTKPLDDVDYMGDFPDQYPIDKQT